MRGSSETSGLGGPVGQIWSTLKKQAPDTTLIALDFPAAPVPITELPSSWSGINQIGDFTDSAWQGSVELVSQIDRAVDECGEAGQTILLAGYSQGAWVIHAALNYLNSVDSPLLDHVTAVALVADPLRSSENSLSNAGTAEVGGGVATSLLGQGFLQYTTAVQGLVEAGWGTGYAAPNLSAYAYPDSLWAQTVELCNAYDAVCDFRNMEADYPLYFLGAFKGGLYVHSNYGEAQLMEVAQVLLREAS